MLTFHSRVKQAETFSKNVPVVTEWLRRNRRLHAPKVWSHAVSGVMPVSRREKILEQLDQLEGASHGIVANARCLGEGVDVPSIDGIAFVQPKHSAIDIVQAVGRAIRKSKKKDGISTIILPVPVLDLKNADLTVESSAFKTVWRVLEALRAHDDVLAESLDKLRTKLGERKNGKIRLPKLTLDLPRSVTAAFSDSIRLQIVRSSTEYFWEGLGRLEFYKAEHDHCRVPSGFKAKDGFYLGNWVRVRRSDYKNGNLSQGQKDALVAIGFVVDPFEEDFQEGLGYLKAYKAEHGHLWITQKYVTEDGYRLSEFQFRQRSSWREGKLSQDRIDALNALGFIWDPHEERFQVGLGYLKGYKSEHNNCKVLASHRAKDGYKLGNWVFNRRTEYREGKLSQDRIDALNALGFIWELGSPFSQKLLELKAYKAEHGHCRVPAGFKTEDGFRLGKWVTGNRTEYREGKLSQDRIDALNALGFIWDLREEDFQEGLGYLKAYRAEHGHTSFNEGYVAEDGYELGGWLRRQRKYYKARRFSQDRIDALNALGFIGDPHEERFRKGLGHLKTYKSEHGDFRVPGDYVAEDGYKLGSWLYYRRREYREGKLSQDRIDALNALGFIWNPR